jgi:hypothetical protein
LHTYQAHVFVPVYKVLMGILCLKLAAPKLVTKEMLEPALEGLYAFLKEINCQNLLPMLEDCNR